MGVLDGPVNSKGLRVVVLLLSESVLCHVYISGSRVAAEVISTIKAVAADRLGVGCGCES